MLIHALRLRNVARELPRFDELPRYSETSVFDVALASVLNAKEHRKWTYTLPILYQTPFGAAFRTTTGPNDPAGVFVGGMTHVDKVLSTLGELGFGLDLPLVSHEGTNHILADVLEDSLKRWYSGRESEWTVLAYCTYLRDQNSWMSADGHVRSVDDVLQAVLEAPRGPCFGAHRLYGLARACMRARETPSFYSPRLLAEAEAVLRQTSSDLARTQLPDGSWRLQQDQVASLVANARDRPVDVTTPSLDIELRIILTAHMLEWFAIADADLRPPNATIERAARFLEHKLVSYSSDTYFGTHLLPAITHGIRALFHLRDLADPLLSKRRQR